MDCFTDTDKLGNKFFYKDKEKKVLHREDGPAIEHVNGSKQFYIDGLWVTEEWYTTIFPRWKETKK